MNKLIKLPLDPRRYFADHFFAVESVTAEGNPFTFATIYHNKKGRTNLCRIGGHRRFLAGSRSKAAVAKYAKTVDPDTTRMVFIERGQIIDVTPPASV